MFQHYKQEWNFPCVVIFIYMESRRKHDKNMYHKKRLINHIKWLKNNKTKAHGITKLKSGYSRLKIIRCLVKQTWIRHRNFTHININTPPSWSSRFVCLPLNQCACLAGLVLKCTQNKPSDPTRENKQKFHQKRRQIYFFIYTKCLSCFTKRFWDCSFFSYFVLPMIIIWDYCRKWYLFL